MEGEAQQSHLARVIVHRDVQEFLLHPLLVLPAHQRYPTLVLFQDEIGFGLAWHLAEVEKFLEGDLRGIEYGPEFDRTRDLSLGRNGDQ